jgi:hypothetical protein
MTSGFADVSLGRACVEKTNHRNVNRDNSAVARFCDDGDLGAEPAL